MTTKLRAFFESSSSTLDQWDFEGKAFIAISVCIALFILPFAIYLSANQSWTLAIYLWSGILLSLSLATTAYFSHRVRLVSLLFNIALAFGTYLTIHLLGHDYAIIAFPVILISFYLLPVRLALITTGIPVILTCYLQPHNISWMELNIFYTSLLVAALGAIAMRFQVQKFQSMASLDPLTGVGNRRAMSQKLNHVIEQRDINITSSSLLIVDFDHFKMINDKFGHDIGDSILKRVMDIIQERLRETDSIFRFGGEEFVVVLEKANIRDAYDLAEELRKTIANAEMAHGHRVTISIGIAEIKANESISEWMKRGDRALFQAKKNGRNQCVLAETEQPVVNKSLA